VLRIRSLPTPDGGVVSLALDADCDDEIVLSVVPMLLGKGVPLYRGDQRHRFDSQYLGRPGATMQTMPKIEESRFYTSQWDDLWGFVLDNPGSVLDGTTVSAFCWRHRPGREICPEA